MSFSSAQIVSSIDTEPTLSPFAVPFRVDVFAPTIAGLQRVNLYNLSADRNTNEQVW
jgi:hypothetical protein